MWDDYARVEYQEDPNAELELWALCSQKKATQWAEELLESLWEEFRKPLVFVNGKRIKKRKPHGWKPPEYEDDSAGESEPAVRGIPPGVERLKVRGLPRVLVHGQDPQSGRWTIWHEPTKAILSHPTSRWDAKYLGAQFARYARTGFDAKDPETVIRSLPRRFGDYLGSRGFKQSFSDWKEENPHL